MPSWLDRLRNAGLAFAGGASSTPSTEDTVAQEAGSHAGPQWGNTDARIGTYNLDTIAQDTYDLMEADPVIGLGLELRTLGLTASDWSCQGPDPKVAAYVEAVLEPIMPTLLRNCVFHGALRGCLPAELVWEKATTNVSYKESPVEDPKTGALVDADGKPWDHFQNAAPAAPPDGSAPAQLALAADPAAKESVDPEAGAEVQGDNNSPAPKDAANIAAIAKAVGAPKPPPPPPPAPKIAKSKTVEEDIEGWKFAKFKPLSLKQVYAILIDGQENFCGFRCVTPNVDLRVEDSACFLFSHNPWPSISAFWGRPDGRRVYDAWYRKQYLEDCYVQYLQRFATPVTTIKYPEGETRTGDQNKDIADGIGLLLTQGGAATVSIPQREGLDVAQWGIEFQEAANAEDLYEKALLYYNTQMFRGMLIPDRMVTGEGATGSYAMSKTHRDVFMMAEDGLMAEVLNAINKQLVPLIVSNTFGEDVPMPQIVSTGLSEQKQMMLEQVLLAVLGGKAQATDIDMDALADNLGIPLAQQDLSATTSNDPTQPEKGTAAIDAAESGLRDNIVQLSERVQAMRMRLEA